jgi:endonuclease YncB( thermonuclease family)
MPAVVFSKGASTLAAPFSLWLPVLTLLFSTLPQTAHASACPATSSSERVRVVHVYDGDTVKLGDGRRLRIIGINTPELGKGDAATEPLANEARARLQELLDTNNRTLLLQYDAQHKDHYGRLLAHAFTESGDNIASILLQGGLATTLVVPPNTWGMDCYQRLENDARIDRRGLWQLPSYQSRPVRELSADTRGYRIVQGRVSDVHESKHTVWIELDGPLTLQISRKDLPNFDSLDSLAGTDVEVRGWIRQVEGGLRMSLQHPAALTVITAEPARH